MGKRQREPVERDDSSVAIGNKGKREKVATEHQIPEASKITVQIVVGTYERVLHGIQATILRDSIRGVKKGPVVEFSDTFLLNPHGSAIRCLAVSPPSRSGVPEAQKVILASGGSDQIINLYHLSRRAPSQQSDNGPEVPTLTGNNVKENTSNRELGSLQHHGGSLNALYFPTRSKLLSAAEDNTIAVARTRDWTVLSTIKAPIPKAHGRPSGDTAPFGGTPMGVNDFAIHPSMKLMISVGKGEKCIRLWNLVTGKKAGVLNFDRGLLQGVGEGRWASGEGRRVKWDSLGEEFVVAFDRGCVVFGMDCTARCRILPTPRTKIHQLRYVSISTDGDETKEILAVSTEDGRIIFYSTALAALETNDATDQLDIPTCRAIGQLGGLTEGLTGRIKDFEILRPPDSQNFLIVTGSSDGAVRVWQIDKAAVPNKPNKYPSHDNTNPHVIGSGKKAPEKSIETEIIGTLLGSYEAGNRITCLTAFFMIESSDVPLTDVQMNGHHQQ